MKDSLVEKLAKEPLTYINGGGMMISLMDIQSYITIAFYAVSIITSLVLVYKYSLEIKKLKDQEPTEPKR
jgi:hypothetical protein